MIETFIYTDISSIVIDYILGPKSYHRDKYDEVLEELKYSSFFKDDTYLHIWVQTADISERQEHTMARVKDNKKIIPYYKLYIDDIKRNGYTDGSWQDDCDLEVNKDVIWEDDYDEPDDGNNFLILIDKDLHNESIYTLARGKARRGYIHKSELKGVDIILEENDSSSKICRKITDLFYNKNIHIIY